MNPKLVSVIIPVYNGATYLAEALDSVFAQDYRPIEVIVVDDGSTDDTAVIARSYSQVRYLHEVNQGPAVARNTGLIHCTGDLIGFLDADDRWVLGKLSLQAKYLEAHPEVDCVIGRMKNFVQESIPRPSWVEDFMLSDDWVAYHQGALLARRGVFEEVGLFSASFASAEDYDWLIRFRESNISMAKMPEVFLLRRIHLNNRCNDAEKRTIKIQHRFKLLKEEIARKRLAQSTSGPA
jgi:glycosyltransferase involved in cell wall biosynthesis